MSIIPTRPFKDEVSRVDPAAKLPKDVFLYTLSFLSEEEQKQLFLISKVWNQYLNIVFEEKLKEIQKKAAPLLLELLTEKISKYSFKSHKDTYIKITNWAKNLTEICMCAFYKSERLNTYEITKSNDVILKALEIISWIKTNSKEAEKIIRISNWENYHVSPKFNKIPNEIALFSNLQCLTILSNIKHVSQRLLQLKNLEYVSLTATKEEGIHFPEHLLEHWVKLQYLYLWNFSSIAVKELAHLKNLKSLLLKNCNIKDFPQEILGLTKITHLDLTDNCISEIPTSIFSLNLNTESKKLIGRGFKNI